MDRWFILADQIGQLIILLENRPLFVCTTKNKESLYMLYKSALQGMLTLYYEWLHGGTRNWASWLLRQDVLRVSVFTQKLHATCNYVRMNFMSNTKYDLKYWIPSCRVRMFQTIYKYINIMSLKKNLNWWRLYFERGYFDPFKTFNYLDEI